MLLLAPGLELELTNTTMEDKIGVHVHDHSSSSQNAINAKF
jgi:hypothetical protein